jgi:hypothetical protein
MLVNINLGDQFIKFLKLSHYGSIENFMASLAQLVSVTGLCDRIFNERQLGEALGGGHARRYGAVNRALKDGSLLRLKRGTYTLARPFHRAALHPFAVAQAIHPESYISFESALAYHGWIPEAVFVAASVTPVSRGVTPNLVLLQNALVQAGPWAGHTSLRADMPWLNNSLSSVIGSITWKEAATDVERFLRPGDMKSVDLWSERFFLAKLNKLMEQSNGQ